jgi:hypothetical protein
MSSQATTPGPETEKKRTAIAERKLKIFSEVLSIFNENFSEINVTKDLQR